MKIEFTETFFMHSIGWRLEVWKLKEINDDFIEKTKSRYGDCIEFSLNECSDVYSGTSSELKGEKVIVIVYDGRDFVLVHELIHAMWHFSRHSGVEMNHDSQEWQAILFEHLYRHCMTKSNWKVL